MNQAVLMNQTPGKNLLEMINRWVALFALGAIVLFFSILNKNFFSPATFNAVGLTLSVIGIICIGQALCILTGGFDLSVGEVAAFSAILAAMLCEKAGLPYWQAVLASMSFGVAAGFINGVLIAKFKINALITTLAFMSVYRGCVYILSKGYSVTVRNPDFSVMGTTRILGLPLPILILLVFFVVFYGILRFTVFGRYVYAIGGNAEAARISGINPEKVQILVYTLSSSLAAFAGLILASRLGAAQATAGGSYALDSVAAVVLGGIALSGGKGNIWGAFLGISILCVLQTGLIMINMPIYYQFVTTGGVLILAVLLQTFEERRKT